MRRVFYFSGFRMKVFEWHRKQLLGSFSFEPTAEGKQEFSDFLDQAPPLPGQLLVDIIEEDFRRETVPHVNSRERQALVTRLVDRHYRDDKHNHVSFLGRSKEGRRDDEVLLSALTNMELLNPWLTLLDEHNVALAGIWSLPLLLSGVLKMITEGEANALIVSRQITTAQRETFFRDGKLIFSRQAKIDHNDRDDVSAETTAKNITSGTDQIHHFITNQRIIGFVDPMSVFCLMPDDSIAEVEKLCESTKVIQYKFIGLEGLFKKFKLKNCEGKGPDALFSYCCSEKSLFKDHYGLREQKLPFYSFIIDRSFDTVATLGALLMVTAAVLLWLSNMDIKQQQVSEQANLTVLERRYNQEFGAMSNQIGNAELVKAAVDHSTLLRLEAAQTPQYYFKSLSQVFSQPRFLPLSIREFDWVKYPAYEIQQLLVETLGQQSQESEEEYYPEDESYGEDGEISVQTKQQATLKISGELNRENLSYRDTVTTMLELRAALEALPLVEEVHLLRTPVDVRPDNRFTDKSGLEKHNYASDDMANHYSLLLVLNRGQYD